MDGTRSGRGVASGRRRLLRLLSRATLVTCLLPLVACQELLGLGDYAVAHDAGTSTTNGKRPPKDASHDAAFAFIDATCGDCATAHCSTELDACDGDAVCSGWQQCMAACVPGNGACEHACFQAAGKTDRTMGDLSLCEFSHCYDACKASVSSSALSPTCGSAVAQGCDAQLRACAADAPCREFFACMFEKNCVVGDGALDPPDGAANPSAGPVGWNPGCARPCFDRAGMYVPRSVDGGLVANPLDAVGVCTFIQSAAACGLGELSCTGRYKRPTSASLNAVTVDLWAFTSSFPETVGTPIPRAPVSACRLQYQDCYPVAGYTTQGSTDDDGHVSFRLPTNGLGIAWYFELTPSWPNGPGSLILVPARNLAEDTALVLPADPAGNVMQLQQADDLVGGYGAVYILFKGCTDFPVQGLEARVDGNRRPDAVTHYDALHIDPTPSTTMALMGGVEPGLRVISAWKDIAGRGKVKIAQTSVMVKANSVTYVPWFEPLEG